LLFLFWDCSVFQSEWIEGLMSLPRTLTLITSILKYPIFNFERPPSPMAEFNDELRHFMTGHNSMPRRHNGASKGSQSRVGFFIYIKHTPGFNSSEYFYSYFPSWVHGHVLCGQMWLVSTNFLFAKVPKKEELFRVEKYTQKYKYNVL
jgi:hypothetical protein